MPGSLMYESKDRITKSSYSLGDVLAVLSHLLLGAKEENVRKVCVKKHRSFSSSV